MSLEKIEKIISLLDDSLKEEGNNLLTFGDIIKDGYDVEVDAYRETISQARDWLTEYQSQLVKNYGITTLRIKFTNNSGYFIEIPKTQIGKIPDTFIHIQTLVNASRYTTQELNTFQEKLSEAENNMAQKEYEIFCSIRENILGDIPFLKQTSQKISLIDFLSALSTTAHTRGFCKPEIYQGYDVEIEAGRHPIVESISRDFVSNSLKLTQKDFIHLIT